MSMEFDAKEIMNNTHLEDALAFLHSAVNKLRSPELLHNQAAIEALDSVAAAYVKIEEVEAYNKSKQNQWFGPPDGHPNAVERVRIPDRKPKKVTE